MMCVIDELSLQLILRFSSKALPAEYMLDTPERNKHSRCKQHQSHRKFTLLNERNVPFRNAVLAS
jgi:hypothetical protein